MVAAIGHDHHLRCRRRRFSPSSSSSCSRSSRPSVRLARRSSVALVRVRAVGWVSLEKRWAIFARIHSIIHAHARTHRYTRSISSSRRVPPPYGEKGRYYIGGILVLARLGPRQFWEWSSKNSRGKSCPLCCRAAAARLLLLHQRHRRRRHRGLAFSVRAGIPSSFARSLSPTTSASSSSQVSAFSWSSRSSRDLHRATSSRTIHGSAILALGERLPFSRFLSSFRRRERKSRRRSKTEPVALLRLPVVIVSPRLL